MRGCDLDLVYGTVSSPDPGDGLQGMPYDKALSPFLAPKGGKAAAINGAGGRWMRALLGLQVGGGGSSSRRGHLEQGAAGRALFVMHRGLKMGWGWIGWMGPGFRVLETAYSY